MDYTCTENCACQSHQLNCLIINLGDGSFTSLGPDFHVKAIYQRERERNQCNHLGGHLNILIYFIRLLEMQSVGMEINQNASIGPRRTNEKLKPVQLMLIIIK